MKLLPLLFFFLIICNCDAQVNLQTGAVQYSLPFYSYSDPANRIGTSVSLVYTAVNGLKVSEVPSSVGTGWAIQCGGFIERIQKGEPDDQYSYLPPYPYPLELDAQNVHDFYNWARNYVPFGYLHISNNLGGITNAAANTPLLDNPAAPYKPFQNFQLDREQDIFSFNFNGRTGSFIIGKKDQNGVSEIRTLVDSRLKITKVEGDLNNNNNIRTTISEFHIVDESGIKYIFRDGDLDQVAKYNKGYTYDWYGTSLGSYHAIPGPTGNYWTNAPDDPQMGFMAIKGELQNSYVKNKWHLSEIVNPLTGKSILFEYDTYNYSMDGNKTAQNSLSDGKQCFTLTIEKLAGISKRLKKVILSSQESIEFNYSTADRVDLPADKKLDNIVYKYDGTVSSKIEFEHGYFVKTSILPLNHNYTTEEKVWARLCLKSVRKISSTGAADRPYTFSYYMGNEDGVNSAVPPIFSYQQDYWGYYNPYFSTFGFYNPSLQQNHQSYAPYEPYGGTLLPKPMYRYATNTLLAPVFRRPSIEARNGVIKAITFPLGGSLSFEYGVNYFAESQGIINGSGGIRVEKIIEFDGNNHTNDRITEYKYIKADGSSSAWGFEATSFQKNESYRTYKKCGNKQYAGINIPDLATDFHRYWSDYQVRTPSIQRRMLTPFEHLVDKAVTQMVVGVIVNSIVSLLQPDYADYSNSTWYSNALNLANPLPYQYSRVEIVNKLLTQTTGKTVYEFTTPTETNTTFQIDFPSQATPFSQKQRFAYWLYGAEKIVSVYDAQGNLVSKVENTYNPVKYFYTQANFQSMKWAPNKKTYSCEFWSFDFNTDQIDFDYYYPICGRLELTSTKKTFYNAGGNSTYAITEYEYSPSNYLPNKVKATNSKGELVETNTFYPGDYTLAGAIQSMKDNNMINTPVSSQAFITKTGNQKYLLSGSVSEFSVLTSGDIKPVKSYAFRNDNPVPSASVVFNAAQLIPNATYYKETGSVSYDGTGMPVQANSEGGRKATTIFDNGNKIAIATVADADPADVAYTSFEADGKGGWDFTDNNNIVSEFSPTGYKNFYFSSANGYSILRTISNSKTYTLCFWAKSDVPYVYFNGSSNVLQPVVSYANAKTGWTWYEYTFTGTGTIEITNMPPFHGFRNTFSIDELRLYPKSATMSTTTVDPIKGKLCETDANGRSTYYEYDELGRLKIIKDQHLNVIKAFEYQYKQ